MSLWAFAAPLPKVLFSDGKEYDNYMTEGFGHARSGRLHGGADFRAPVGTPILAIRSGVVTFAGTYNDGNTAIEVVHDDKTAARYLHHQSTTVAKGQRIAKGQTIGRTGFAKSPHLHLDLWVLPSQLTDYVRTFGQFAGTGGSRVFADKLTRWKVPMEPLVPATYQDDVIDKARQFAVQLYRKRISDHLPKILIVTGVLGAAGFSTYKIVQATRTA